MDARQIECIIFMGLYSHAGIHPLVMHITCSSDNLLIESSLIRVSVQSKQWWNIDINYTKTWMQKNKILTTNRFKTYGLNVDDDSYMSYWLHAEYHPFVRIIKLLLPINDVLVSNWDLHGFDETS
jgi:hypothetical protein